MQVELHRHLDISVRPATLHALALRAGTIPAGTPFEEFRDRLVLKGPLRSLEEVLATFEVFQHVYTSREICEQVAFETVEDCRREGTRAVELRFAPGFVGGKTGLSWEDATAGFAAGLRRATAAYPEMRAGLICIAVRDQGVEEVERAVEFFLSHRSEFVGLDLAGNEDRYPCRLYAGAFSRAKTAGARITIHAGEASGPENIWEAIEILGAERIGHGIAAIRDPALMAELARRGVCLEVCPTSNWLTQAVPSLRAHPLPALLRAGVPVSLNTDDPTVFGVGLDDEMRNARMELGLSEAEIRLLEQHAESALFLLPPQ